MWRLGFAAQVCLASVLFPATALSQGGEAPYVPTPQVVVDAMLRLGAVGPRDFVIDLGAGDGRIVITAAKQFGARGLGVDLDESLLAFANDAAGREGVAGQVAFRRENLFATDLSQATVVTTYLLPEMNLKLRPKLLRLAPGTRVVAHDYHFGDWIPDERETLRVPEKTVGDPGLSYIYLWIVPAQLGGNWRSRIGSGGRELAIELVITQRYQYVEGHALVAGARKPLVAPHLRGDALHFGVDLPDGPSARRYSFRGRIVGDEIRGVLSTREGGASQEQPWTAQRAAANRRGN